MAFPVSYSPYVANNFNVFQRGAPPSGSSVAKNFSIVHNC